MNSLQGHLSVRLFVSLLVVFTLQWLAVSYSIHQVTEDYVISRLEHDADSLLAAVSFDQQGQATIPDGAIDSIYSAPFSGHYYLLTNPGAVLRSRSLWDQTLPVDSIGTGQRLRFKVAGPKAQELLVLQQAYRKKGHQINIVVAEDLTVMEQDIRALQMQYLGLSLLFLLLLTGLQYLGVRRVLLPLEKIQGQIEALMNGRRELLDEDVPSEVRPLIQEINHLLELLRRRLSHSRLAIGNLAHALKTPLTVLRQLAGQLPADSVEQLQSQLSSMQSLLDRELKLARLAGSGPAAVGFRPEEDLAGLVAVLEKIYPDIHICIEQQADTPLQLSFDREDLMECLGNLLDNACKWATQTVRVRLDATQGLSVTIEDDGPGCSPEALKKLGTRGLRLDESVAGHGLGLSICRDIADQYRGSLEFDQSTELKGLRVQLVLPRVQIAAQSNRPSTDR